MYGSTFHVRKVGRKCEALCCFGNYKKKYHLSRDTAHPTVFMHTQRQIDLRRPHEDGLSPQLSKERTAKTNQSIVC